MFRLNFIWQNALISFGEYLSSIKKCRLSKFCFHAKYQILEIGVKFQGIINSVLVSQQTEVLFSESSSTVWNVRWTEITTITRMLKVSLLTINLHFSHERAADIKTFSSPGEFFWFKNPSMRVWEKLLEITDKLNVETQKPLDQKSSCLCDQKINKKVARRTQFSRKKTNRTFLVANCEDRTGNVAHIESWWNWRGLLVSITPECRNNKRSKNVTCKVCGFTV